MGARIKLLRRQRGLTQPQLADACGVSRSAVAQWEDNSTENIKLQVLWKLLKALNTDLEYLLWGLKRRPDGESPSPRKKPAGSE